MIYAALFAFIYFLNHMLLFLSPFVDVTFHESAARITFSEFSKCIRFLIEKLLIAALND